MVLKLKIRSANNKVLYFDVDEVNKIWNVKISVLKLEETPSTSTRTKTQIEDFFSHEPLQVCVFGNSKVYLEEKVKFLNALQEITEDEFKKKFCIKDKSEKYFEDDSAKNYTCPENTSLIQYVLKKNEDPKIFKKKGSTGTTCVQLQPTFEPLRSLHGVLNFHYNDSETNISRFRKYNGQTGGSVMAFYNIEKPDVKAKFPFVFINKGSESYFDFLKNDEHFMEYRAVVQRNPAKLQDFMHEFMKKYPKLINYIRRQPEEFVKLLSE